MTAAAIINRAAPQYPKKTFQREPVPIGAGQIGNRRKQNGSRSGGSLCCGLRAVAQRSASGEVETERSDHAPVCIAGRGLKAGIS